MNSNEITNRTSAQLSANLELRELCSHGLPILGEKWDVHLPVFLSAPSIARILWLNEVYLKALNVPGRVVEFGCQWGASLNIFLMLRLIHEPWNPSRIVTGFSTFGSGFEGSSAEDGALVSDGMYKVEKDWPSKLDEILSTHATGDLSQSVNQYEIVEGDATETFGAWLKDNPEAIISHAHFDMDIYAPTKAVLEMVMSRMPKGAILIFDQINCRAFPGETIALDEVLGISNLSLKRSSLQPYSAYAVVGA